MDELRFFNPYAEIRHTANRLPHWQQQGAVYFITFRLADAVPENLRSQWEAERTAWLRFHPEPWNPETEHEYHTPFPGRLSAGLMPATARVFCDEAIAPNWWLKRFATSTVNVLSSSHPS